jgi:Holliday junction resolvase RusA-like endonuclease
VLGKPVGEPRAQPSRAGGRLRMHRNAVADPWKRAVRRACLSALGLVLEPRLPVYLTGQALLVVATFRLERPLDHHVARKRNRPLKARAPGWPLPKPDIDNLAKAVLDALGPWPKHARPILWADDQQIVAISCEKVYATPEAPPGASVVVHVLSPAGP